MAANEFSVQIFNYVMDVEVTSLGGHLCVEEDLEKKIAELILEVGPGATLDGIEDLVGLLERVSLDRVEGLLAVPGAAIRGAQPCHDRYRLCNRVSVSGSDPRREILGVGLGHTFNFTR